jgi:hypothetical protein
MSDFEKLGAFYLGRRVDADAKSVTGDIVLYDSKDLTTHAVCVGMTGSGKTGLAIGLIEEAAIDGIPIIAIDPKGDLANLLLTFPELRPSDFRPWINEAEAARAARSPDDEATDVAERWRKGLAEWGQDPSRIARYANAVERTIYTPGSGAGRPVAALRSLSPPPAQGASAGTLRERAQGVVSGLLSLVSIESDPLQSREHILLSTLLSAAWAEGRGFDLAGLIRAIQTPPLTQVGIMDLETFYPASERFELAMALNNLLASPGFAAWLEGDPLDVGSFLYGAGGKPRLSIFSIAHLSDSERMFFVTLLLNEILAWTRAQPGAPALRALVYMDEVFGYFPPTAAPPSKAPMLTLLKQARAFGVGIVLATQNPADLDYKGLSNAGTWFIGRLQTERDKARVLDGLEGASSGGLDRVTLDRLISGLGNRVFLLHNTHEDGPVLFHTRWALSYLAGPLTREQISRLQPSPAPAPGAASPSPATTPGPPPAVGQAPPVAPASARSRPVLPPAIPERFLSGAGAGDELRPALVAECTAHYVLAKASVDEWRKICVIALLDDASAATPWEHAAFVSAPPMLEATAPAGAAFRSLPSAATKPPQYERWKKMLETTLYQTRALQLWQCKALGLTSRPGEREEEFRGRVALAQRGERDAAVEKLRQKYAPKLLALDSKMATARSRVSKEEAQLAQAKTSTAISVGATVLGALLGRKVRSATNVGRAATAMRSAGRAREQAGDVELAKDRVERLEAERAELEAAARAEIDALKAAGDAASAVVEALVVAPRKQDLSVDALVLAWVPGSFAPTEAA